MDEEEKRILGEQGGIVPPTPAAEATPAPIEKTFLQADVDRIAGQARADGRAAAMKGLYDQYGVAGDEELHGLFGNGQLYQGLNEQYLALKQEHDELRKQHALMQSTMQDGLDPSAYEDVVAIAASKGLEINPETIRSLLETRPYWRKSGAAPSAPLASGFSDPLPPIPQPQPAAAPQTQPQTPPFPMLPEQEAELPAPPPAPERKSVITRIGNQPHPSGGSSMTPEELAKSMAGVGRPR